MMLKASTDVQSCIYQLLWSHFCAYSFRENGLVIAFLLHRYFYLSLDFSRILFVSLFLDPNHAIHFVFSAYLWARFLEIRNPCVFFSASRKLSHNNLSIKCASGTLILCVIRIICNASSEVIYEEILIVHRILVIIQMNRCFGI